jgi:ubiquinone/menaquinone biosynthesis C-methylase UbiE
MSYGVHLQDYLLLFQLASRRLDSPKAYQNFQHHQGELLVRFLQAHHLVIEGKQVLDLGCGLGGYSMALQEHGANVVSVDLSPLETSGKFQMFCADAQVLPLESESMDWVICASLIEHVSSPETLLWEIQRVLRVGGLAYLSFPPFYTPIGGHQFSPFHLLGERVAIRMKLAKDLFRDRQWLQERYPETPDSYAQAFGDWGLYPLTIAKVEKLLRGIPVQILERSTRWLPLDFSGIPILREFLTWHVQFLLRKISSPPPKGASVPHASH